MPALKALLGCPDGKVVQDVIALLTFCRCGGCLQTYIDLYDILWA